MATDTTLDPLENLIADIFAADAILANNYGPYFDFNIDPQGIAYVLVMPRVGPLNTYPLLGRNTSRDVIARPMKQFSVISKDRGLLTDPNTGICAAISRNFEAVANTAMRGQQTCLSILLATPWQIKYDQTSNNIHANMWHAFADFLFTIQRPSGAL